MKTEVVLLFPFDLGMELDFSKKQIKDIAHSVSVQNLAGLALQDQHFAEVRAEFRLYRFGVGLIQIS